MKEYRREYDPVSNRTWIYRECTECGSKDLTPMEKTQDGKNSMCYYLCEGCKNQPAENFIYAMDGDYTKANLVERE